MSSTVGNGSTRGRRTQPTGPDEPDDWERVPPNSPRTPEHSNAVTPQPDQQPGRDSTGEAGEMPANLRSIQERCLAYVDEYRSGNITYDTAYVKLHEYISSSAAVVQNVGNSFGNYKAMLDSHRNRLGGNGRAGAASGQPASQPSRNADEISTGERPEGPPHKQKRRLHDADDSSSSGEDSPSSDEEYDRRGRIRDLGKRRRYLEQSTLGRGVPGGLFAFAEDAAITEAELPPALRITRQRIAAFKQDEKAALEFILSTPGRPQFTEALWKSVMLGQYVDFEKIRADSAPGKEDEHARITDYLDWNDCWVRYTKAVSMLFPNRASELSDYQQHVTKLFKAFVPDVHDKVIAYDVAVRKRVAQQGNLLLTDLSAFDDVFQELLHPRGAAASGSRPAKSGKAKKGKSSEKCKRFNAGRCPDNAIACRYRHACSQCNSPDHGANACAKKEKRE